MTGFKPKKENKKLAAITSEKYSIYQLTFNIFKVTPKTGIELDVQDAIEIRKGIISLCPATKFAVMVDGSNYFSTTSELRQLIASEAYTQLRFATAIVTQSMAGKIIGNFFIKVNKPASPTKIFSNEEDAFQWLNHLSLSLQ
jgi:hypothetical protein